MASIFVIDLTYSVDLSEVEAHLPSHRDFLERQYRAGVFLASGRKEPRTGGVILATGSRAVVQRAIAEDPFHTLGIATYEVTEFLPTKTSPELATLRDG
jgi:uncharacterized protein YciI